MHQFAKSNFVLKKGEVFLFKMCSLVQGNVSDSVANTEKCLSLSLQYDNLALETPEETGDSYKCAEVLRYYSKVSTTGFIFFIKSTHYSTERGTEGSTISDSYRSELNETIK